MWHSVGYLKFSEVSKEGTASVFKPQGLHTAQSRNHSIRPIYTLTPFESISCTREIARSPILNYKMNEWIKNASSVTMSVQESSTSYLTHTYNETSHCSKCYTTKLLSYYWTSQSYNSLSGPHAQAAFFSKSLHGYQFPFSYGFPITWHRQMQLKNHQQLPALTTRSMKLTFKT